jgi:hypothetical protein
MAGITLAQAEAKLTLWMAANDAVAGGQEYTIGSRSLSRVDAGEIREQVEFWDGKVKELSRGTTGMRIRGGTPT